MEKSEGTTSKSLDTHPQVQSSQRPWLQKPYDALQTVGESLSAATDQLSPGRIFRRVGRLAEKILENPGKTCVVGLLGLNPFVVAGAHYISGDYPGVDLAKVGGSAPSSDLAKMADQSLNPLLANRDLDSRVNLYHIVDNLENCQIIDSSSGSLDKSNGLVEDLDALSQDGGYESVCQEEFLNSLTSKEINEFVTSDEVACALQKGEELLKDAGLDDIKPILENKNIEACLAQDTDLQDRLLSLLDESKPLRRFVKRTLVERYGLEEGKGIWEALKKRKGGGGSPSSSSSSKSSSSSSSKGSSSSSSKGSSSSSSKGSSNSGTSGGSTSNNYYGPGYYGDSGDGNDGGHCDAKCGIIIGSIFGGLALCCVGIPLAAYCIDRRRQRKTPTRSPERITVVNTLGQSLPEPHSTRSSSDSHPNGSPTEPLPVYSPNPESGDRTVNLNPMLYPPLPGSQEV